jgi:hypothetical protein
METTRSVVDSFPPQAFHALQMLVEGGSPTIWTDLEGALDTIDDHENGCLLQFDGEQVVMRVKAGITTCCLLRAVRLSAWGDAPSPDLFVRYE